MLCRYFWSLVALSRLLVRKRSVASWLAYGRQTGGPIGLVGLGSAPQLFGWRDRLTPSLTLVWIGSPHAKLQLLNLFAAVLIDNFCSAADANDPLSLCTLNVRQSLSSPLVS